MFVSNKDFVTYLVKWNYSSSIQFRVPFTSNCVSDSQTVSYFIGVKWKHTEDWVSVCWEWDPNWVSCILQNIWCQHGNWMRRIMNCMHMIYWGNIIFM